MWRRLRLRYNLASGLWGVSLRACRLHLVGARLDEQWHDELERLLTKRGGIVIVRQLDSHPHCRREVRISQAGIPGIPPVVTIKAGELETAHISHQNLLVRLLQSGRQQIAIDAANQLASRTRVSIYRVTQFVSHFLHLAPLAVVTYHTGRGKKLEAEILTNTSTKLLISKIAHQGISTTRWQRSLQIAS